MREQIESIVVTAKQMRQIEGRIFAAGMPVAALMEKAAGKVAARIQQLYPPSRFGKVGILVGPGHNGGDALVVGRELHLAGFQVAVYRPLLQLKTLTEQHGNYAASLGIPFYEDIEPLLNCDVIIDGLFGFGLTRHLSGKIAAAVNQLNETSLPIVSIDIPSGLHTDTGEVLGTAIRATHTLCLGLWKLAFFQDSALEYLGKTELIYFGIPPSFLSPQTPTIQQITPTLAREYLPLPRSSTTHKYQQGHLLVICGSRPYAGSAILTGLGARASGVGMVSIAVPGSLKPLLVGHLPEALIIECSETETGAIAQLPNLDLTQFNIIACGPGLTLDAVEVVKKVLTATCPLILDADGLNILAELGTIAPLSLRKNTTVLTPHLGEFRRLFPQISNPHQNRIRAVQEAAAQSGAIVLFKGARTAVAHPKGSVWLVPSSTPALARGGSGDVLTGLMGGLMAQIRGTYPPEEAIVATAAWWHATAGIIAAKERTELGVDAYTLSQYLSRVLVMGYPTAAQSAIIQSRLPN